MMPGLSPSLMLASAPLRIDAFSVSAQWEHWVENLYRASGYVSATGGTAPYAYLWSSVGGNFIGSNTNSGFEMSRGAPVATGVTVTVTDAVGAVVTASGVVGEGEPE